MYRLKKSLNKQGERLEICFVFKGDIFGDNAPANRVKSLVDGLKAAGSTPYIYGLVPFTSTKHLFHERYNSILFSYPKIISDKFLFRAVLSFIGLFSRFPKIILINKIDIVYLYGVPVVAKYIIIFFGLILRYKVVEEKNEYPLFLLTSNKFKQFFGKFFKIFEYRLLDGMVVMTDTLFRFYQPLVSQKTKIEIINMIVNLDRFENLKYKKVSDYNYFAYCGSLNQRKDGILTSIQAFALVVQRFPNIKFIIIGQGSKSETQTIAAMIQKLNLQNNLISTGLLNADDVPGFLLNAVALLLPRPDTLQSKGGFPTKLGEYLATGKPVIATKVGEIPKFLKDGVNAFLAEPDSIESLYLKMIEVLTNIERSKTIGLQGRKLTLNEFNHVEQSKKLHDFLHKL